ncbi:MAG: prenyltransferase/squalene oxidase repeat-containing protein [Solirubrobacterales bacterium]
MRRLVALSLSLLLFAAAAALAATPANQQRLDSTVRYLQEAQNLDGGFGGEPGDESLQGISAWVALALASAGINPQDQRKPGGADAYSFLAGHFRQGVEDETCDPEICTTALERELMVVNASGTSPHAFGPVDLVAELLPRQDEEGWFPFVPGGVPAVNTTVFAILGLALVDEPAAQSAIGPAADWLEGAQQDSGGWAWSSRESPDEVDMTGAAIQALVAAGRYGSPAIDRGIEYLHEAQNPDGCFPEMPGDPESNVASTAWATEAIWAVGQNPEDWRTQSGEPTEEPLDCLASFQEADGHLRWKHSQDLNGIWMTAYAAPAFAGKFWLFHAVPRVASTTSPPDDGEGGGSQSGSGVIAGGGGDGAPLFSRPQPQSKGRTPGGARLVRNKGLRPVDRSETRRGANVEQPRGSETAEPKGRGSRRELPKVVSGAGTTVGSDASIVSGSGGDSGGSDEGADANRSGGVAVAAGGRGNDADAAAGTDRGGGSGPRGVPLAGPAAAEAAASGRQVKGTLIGTTAAAESGNASARTAFGAPGLHAAGVDEDEGRLLAIGVGVLALLAALAGAGWERRREVAL